MIGNNIGTATDFITGFDHTVMKFIIFRASQRLIETTHFGENVPTICSVENTVDIHFFTLNLTVFGKITAEQTFFCCQQGISPVVVNQRDVWPSATADIFTTHNHFDVVLNKIRWNLGMSIYLDNDISSGMQKSGIPTA